MEIQERQQGNVLILEPAGRLDSLTCRAFETRLLAALDPARRIVRPWSSGRGSDYRSSPNELAEQFGWLELRQRILQAGRSRVLAV